MSNFGTSQVRACLERLRVQVLSTSFIDRQMLASRLRLFAWVFGLVALVVLALNACVGLPQLRLLYAERVYAPTGIPEPLWLPRLLGPAMMLLAASLPLACLRLNSYDSSAAGRAAQPPHFALALGLAGASLLGLLGLHVDAQIEQLSEALLGVALSTKVFCWQAALLGCGWLSLVLLAQSHAAELWTLHRRGRPSLTRALTFAGAWMLALLAGLALARSGLEFAFDSKLWEVERLALAPLVALLAAELTRSLVERIGPRLRQHWHEQRAQTRALRDITLEAQRYSPDPSALAQGHRLRTRAAWLRAAAWLSLTPLIAVWVACYPMFEFGGILPLALLGLVLLVLSFDLRSFRPQPTQVEPAPLESGLRWARPRVRERIEQLLEHLEHCAELLEHDRDRAYDEACNTLAVKITELGQRELEQLDALGVDPHLLLRQLFEAHEPGQPLRADRRRAHHHQLRKFIARARGQNLPDPYRADFGRVLRATGLRWLAGGRSPLDRELARTRRQLLVGVLLVAISAGAFMHLVALHQAEVALDLCVPGIGACRWALGPDILLGALPCLLALTPLWLWMAARVFEWAGQLSFAFSLPPNGELHPCRETVTTAMWAAWFSDEQVGAGERALFRLLALTALLGLPLLVLAGLDTPDDFELALTLGMQLSAGLLALHPLRTLLARLAAKVCD